VGVLVLVLTSRRRRLFSLMATVGVLAVALSFLPSFSGDLGVVVDQRLSDRLESLTELSGDQSFQDRDDFLTRVLGDVAAGPLGYGLGSSGAAARGMGSGAGIASFDNGWLNIPYTLGWAGGAAYLAGVCMLLGVRGGTRLLAVLPIAVGLFASNILVATAGVAAVIYGLLATRAIEAPAELISQESGER
jgi:hypothetical protein